MCKINKILLAVIFSFIVNVTYTQTISVSGSLSGNNTWNADTVKVTGNLTLTSNSSLTILPGTIVEFQGTYYFNIYGKVTAEGTASDSIIFTRDDTTGFYTPGLNGSWFGMNIYNNTLSDSTIFNYCSFRCLKSYVILFNNFSNARVENCSFSVNVRSTLIIRCELSSPVIRNNLFAGEDTTGITILCHYFSSPVISGNNFSHSGKAISISDNSNPLIINNNITGCSITGISSKRKSAPHIIGNYISECYSGIQTDSSQAYIFNNTITRNGDTTSLISMVGGGIYSTYSTNTISNNIITYNYASGGAAISLLNSRDIIFGNLISNNRTTGYGCGATSSGSAILAISSPSELINNVIVNNTCSFFGTIQYYDTDTTYIVNNTIANNYALFGGGLSSSSSDLIIANNIFWGNVAGLSSKSSYGDQIFLDQSFCSFYNNDFTDTTSAQIDQLMPFTDNIFNDPHFVLPSAGYGDICDGVNADWSLISDSPCINAGISDTTGYFLRQTDFNGQDRIMLGTIDIGAYESPLFTEFLMHKKNEDISLFPNPSSSFFFIGSPSPIKKVEVYDLSGKKLLSGSDRKTNISMLLPGTYIVTVYTNETKVNRRLIVK